MIGPEHIAGFYDHVPVDGTMPVDRYAQANLWTRLFQELRQFPELAAQYDLGGIFGWVAQLSGLRNINQFKVNIQDDEALRQQAQRGNVVSLEEVQGDINRAREGDLERVPEPGRTEGMGATG